MFFAVNVSIISDVYQQLHVNLCFRLLLTATTSSKQAWIGCMPLPWHCKRFNHFWRYTSATSHHQLSLWILPILKLPPPSATKHGSAVQVFPQSTRAQVKARWRLCGQIESPVYVTHPRVLRLPRVHTSVRGQAYLLLVSRSVHWLLPRICQHYMLGG